jgi:hypothetical protein
VFVVGMPRSGTTLIASILSNHPSVATASNWQVRQPIYGQSVQRWRHYEKHLAPLIEMLQLAESCR